MTKLDIGYDPEIPDDWQNASYAQFKHHEAQAAEPEPRWPYERGAVRVLGARFERRSHRSKGPDPYAGESWVATIGRLRVVLSNFVCCEFELKSGSRTLARVCECDFKDMLRWWRTAWHFFEDRYQWSERQMPEDYESGYYE